MPRYGQIDADYSKQLRSTPTDGPIYMLGLEKFRPDIEHGSVRAMPHREAGLFYAPIPLLAAAGAALCFAAEVVASAGGWDRVAVIGYESRKSFVELAYEPEFLEWHTAKELRLERSVVMGMLPAGHLPGPASSGRILLEAWAGPAPALLAGGPATVFDVEGTLVGDGRRWTGARFTPIEPGTSLPLRAAAPGYQALLLEPTIERWRWP
ncbi:MAG TPA: hypothetical protein VMB74_05970 [Streptosporangiaceae bacterium]|nr:hypothetical protein [Streptosporangiaceae bacterium]